MKRNVLPLAAAAVAILAGAFLLVYFESYISDQSSISTIAHPTATASKMPLDVEQMFTDREKGGDALGSAYFMMDENFVDDENHCEFCIAAEYTPGPHGKAMVAFRNNEPVDLTAAKALTFIARGETGGENIRVYAAGEKKTGSKTLTEPEDPLRGVKYGAVGQVTLDKEWQKYELGLEGLDLSSVSHAFAFEVLKGKGSQRQVVYIDAIFLEVKPDTANSERLN